MKKSLINPMFPTSLIASGLLIAAFWLLTYPFEGFAGAEVSTHALFIPGQYLHLIGAIMGVVGYFGLYLTLRDSAGGLAFPAAFIAIVGMTLFAADAVIALVIFPTLAAHAPSLLDAAGPMFTGRVLMFYIICYATHMTGIVLLSALMLLYNRVTITGICAFLLGGIAMNLPPIPGMHWIAILGGVLFGFGLLMIGLALLKRGQ
ncbi:MAG: hypothetical protein V3V30_01005 [Parvularculaceae bacterium]